MSGLRSLEYRGYDSSGLGVWSGQRYQVVRASGKLSELSERLAATTLTGTSGLAHTRWATHGAPTEHNAHPHTVGPINIVHNGIVENFRELRAELAAEGRRFVSDTDTEVIAHLIEREVARGADLDEAVAAALRKVEGRYAIVVASEHSPEHLIVARHGSPVVIGPGSGETFVASDVTALLEHTPEVMFMGDGHIAHVAAGIVDCRDESGRRTELVRRRIAWTPTQAQKSGFRHFMLKEIHEQPEAVAETLAGRLEPKSLTDELAGLPRALAEFRSVRFLACGTSYHAGMLGAYWLERIARVRATCELASEFRYRDPVIRPSELIVPISQSGETADTLAALQLSRERGAAVLSICNVMESSIARDSHATLFTRAGPEIGVASTKAFTAQLTCMLLLALARARVSPGNERTVADLCDELDALPQHLSVALGYAPQIEIVARRIAGAPSMLFIGRGSHYPVALEGALKLKELTYVAAQGYAAGEMKHGPIALIEPGYPVIALVPRDGSYARMLASLEEVKARGGQIVAVATRGDTELGEIADHVLLLPWAGDWTQPLLSSIPMQLLAYYAANFLGTDVDQPRNLAKSVTVE